MKKILSFFIITFFLLLQFAVQAQTKQKAEQKFVNQLNSILINSKDNDHWGQTGAMTIDSAFAINKAGILSLTVRYIADDSSFVRASSMIDSIPFLPSFTGTPT